MASSIEDHARALTRGERLRDAPAEGRLRAGDDDEERDLLGGTVEDHVQRTPVRRVGKPEDIAAACSFLISEEAGYITGQILGVNGGRNT